MQTPPPHNGSKNSPGETELDLERRHAHRQPACDFHLDEFSDLLLSDPRLGARFSEGAVECDLRDVPLVFYSGDAFLEGRIVRLAPYNAAISKPEMRAAFLLPPDRRMQRGSPVLMPRRHASKDVHPAEDLYVKQSAQPQGQIIAACSWKPSSSTI